MLDLRWNARVVLAGLPLLAPVAALYGQAPAAARQLGTVTAINGSTVSLKTAAGADVTVSVAPDAPVLQLPPGSTDLKAATPARLEDVAVGDRVLASGTRDGSDTLVASRIVLMKSTEIAARNTSEQRDWQKGLGGLVRGVEGPVVTVVSGAKVLKITTSASTSFKRYADDSVAFADVKPGSLDQIHSGDQLRARGTLGDDHLSMIADQVVYGSFANLSGIVSAVDQGAQTLTLKDSATKKSVTVYITQKSDLRKLPAEEAARFTARNSTAGSAPTGVRGSGEGHRAEGQASAAGSAPGAAPAGGTAARTRSAGMDLSQMLARLPAQALTELHAGEAVMIVASEGANGTPTAITLLSGVEQILSATPSGSAPITLSPWNLGSVPEGGGEGGR